MEYSTPAPSMVTTCGRQARHGKADDGRWTGLKCATNKCAQVEQAKAGGAEGRHLSWQLCNFVKVKHKVVRGSVRGVNSSSISSALVSGALLMPRPFDLYILHYTHVFLVYSRYRVELIYFPNIDNNNNEMVFSSNHLGHFVPMPIIVHR